MLLISLKVETTTLLLVPSNLCAFYCCMLSKHCAAFDLVLLPPLISDVQKSADSSEEECKNVENTF